MIKLSDIEALLNLPYEMEVELKDIDDKFISEMGSFFGSKIVKNDFFDYVTFKRHQVTITLRSKAKDLTGLPDVNLDFLNIKQPIIINPL